MRKSIMTLGSLAAAVLVFTACGGGPDKSAFKNAAPEIKQVWDTAVAADRANNYLAANTNYVSLLSKPVSADQMVAIQGALRDLNERMNTAFAKGDPAAKQAFEELKSRQVGRRPGAQ